MRRLLPSLLLFSFVAAPCLAETTAAPAAHVFKPAFTPGAAWSIQAVLERTRVSPDEKATERLSVPVTMRVAPASDAGTQLEWIDGKLALTSEGGDPGRLLPVRLAATALEGFPMHIAVDADGTPTHVVNAGELAAKLKQALSQLSADQPGTPESAAAAQLIEALTSPAAIAVSAMKSPSILLFWSGAEIAPGEELSLQGELENAFGGPPLPSLITLSMAPLPQGATTATLTMKQVIDATAAAAALKQTLMTIGIPEAMLGSFNLDIVDRGTWTMDLATGMPVSVEHVRTLELGPQQRIERRTFEVEKLGG